jgi:CheY-like chemotaxis protein
VLVVDDIEMNRDMLCALLEADGHKASVAENGRLALELIKANPFDLILLDVMMPEMNGYEVLEHLKSDPVLRDIPVIVLSALDEIGSVVRYRARGRRLLTQAIRSAFLRARIGALPEKKRLRDQEIRLRGELEEGTRPEHRVSRADDSRQTLPSAFLPSLPS